MGHFCQEFERLASELSTAREMRVKDRRDRVQDAASASRNRRAEHNERAKSIKRDLTNLKKSLAQSERQRLKDFERLKDELVSFFNGIQSGVKSMRSGSRAELQAFGDDYRAGARALHNALRGDAFRGRAPEARAKAHKSKKEKDEEKEE